MTKKKKIIIGVASIILAATLITTALLVILSSRIKVTAYDDANYTSHKNAITVYLDNQYKKTFANSVYQNGTELIQNNNNKYGLYSNISSDIVVPTKFDRYAILNSNSDTNKSYFKFYNSGKDDDGFVIYDEHGKKVFNTATNNNYHFVEKIQIKSKTIDIDDDYEVEDITKDIIVKDIQFSTTHFLEGKYHYESWVITDKDGVEYTNLYSIDGHKRELVQTIGDNIGTQIDNNENLAENIHFLKNGTPFYITQTEKTISTSNKVLEIKIYNDELELENKISLENNNPSIKFRIGNYYYIQYTSEGSEEDYDFLITEMGETAYFKLTTHKINLKNGKHSEISTKLLVSQTINTSGKLNASTVNIEQTLLNVYKIENKEISNPTLILANEQLKYKEMTYNFNNITKISKNRFLTKQNNSNYMIINKNYEVIADLSAYKDVFTTKDCVIASDNDNTYICNHDGVVIKRYSIGSVLNVNHSDYYIVLEEDSENNTLNYIRANNGQEFDTVLTLSNSGSDTIKEELSFTNVNTFIDKGYAYMLATQNNGSNSTYSIFNFEGTLLTSFEMATQMVTPLHFVMDDTVIIKIADNTILLKS